MNNFRYQRYFETKLEDMLSRYPDVQIMRRRELAAFEQENDRDQLKKSGWSIAQLAKISRWGTKIGVEPS